jgi:hypothetical protein
MKRVLYAVPVLALFAPVAFSQMPAGQKVGLATSLQRGYANIKQNLTQAAEKMPEADYSWKPGTTTDARPFSAVIAHIVQSQFGQCSAMKGVANRCRARTLSRN